MDSYLLHWGDVSATDASLKALHGPLVAFVKGVDAAAPATSIAVCGSYMTRTLVRTAPHDLDSLPAVDICVLMPSAACSEDEANKGLYEVRRAAFCASIAEHLNANVEGCEATVAKCPTRRDKSMVRVVFSGAGASGRCPIHIHPRLDGISEYLAKAAKKRAKYIGSILEDASALASLKIVHGIFSTRPNYVRAAMVLKAWAAHCGLTAAPHSPFYHSEQLQPCVFPLLIAALHEEGILAATMSEENLLRTVWVQIARGCLDGPKLSLPQLTDAFPLLNVLHRTSQRFIDVLVKPAAEEALKQTAAIDAFVAPRITFPMLFTTVLRVAYDPSIVTEGGNVSATTVHDIISYALSDRLSHAFVEIAAPGEAVIYTRVRSGDGRNKLSKGPSLEKASETDKFTKFWGAEAVSTRQFGDGSIHKCVAWGDACLSSGRTALAGHVAAADVTLPVADVTRVIVDGALRRHLSGFIAVSAAFGAVGDVVCERIGESYVDTAPIAHKTLQSASAEAIRVVNAASPALACRVVGFDVVSASVRECEPYPIRPHAALTAAESTAPLLCTAPTIEPVYCVLTIDDKNKIPDTLEAIKAMKGALCAQLSNALTESGHESYCTTISVDLVLGSGFVFRIFIAHFREVSLLRALERAPQADMLERKLFWAAQHHKYVASVLVGVHGTYSKAARLAKRWVGAMLLADFVAPEAIELLVGYSYLVPANKPRSAEEGLYRFLQLLATRDWSTPLVVDPTITVDHKKTWDREAVGMIILATYDSAQSSPFTTHTPRPMILHRLAALASGAVRAFEEGRFPSMWLCDAPSSFDAVLPLAPAMALASDRCIARAPPAPAQFRLWRAGDLAGADRQRYITQLCELEPANFCLRALRTASRDRCMIFMDAYGPQSLAVVSLSERPTPNQLRALVSSLVEAAPKGSLGHVELPPAEAPKPKQPKQEKKEKAAEEGEAPKKEKKQPQKEKKAAAKTERAEEKEEAQAEEPSKTKKQRVEKPSKDAGKPQQQKKAVKKAGGKK